MKKIMNLLILIPFIGFAQTTPINVTLQARDCEYIGYFTGQSEVYEDVDSLLKKAFRPAVSAPSGTTNVAINGATNGAWFQVSSRLRREAPALDGSNNPFTRLDAILRALNNVWLTGALDADTSAWDAAGYSNNRTAGRKRLKKE